MADDLLSLSSGFDEASEADWLGAVEKALKGGGIEKITRQTRDGIKIKPLYRETDFKSAQDPLGAPGAAPYLRGAHIEPNLGLQWDIRQRFTHPDPATTNAEILRDLERGVTGVELAVDCLGQTGIQLCDAQAIKTALTGVKADIAPIALDHCGAGTGASIAALLALWAEDQDTATHAKLAFNIDPIGVLMRTGKLGGGLDKVYAKTAALTDALALRFPLATVLRADARPVHEAGGTEAQELAALIASAVDTMRRLDAAGLKSDRSASQFQFTLSVDGNYGIGIAKLRAARQLWARIQSAMDLSAQPMRLQAVTSARMLTRYDPWVNMLRGTAACFAAAVGGADVITVRPFNEALGLPEELGRRIARNTQIMAMEESGLGRVSDPSGGAWFTETLARDMAEAAWVEFQQIESEGGLAQSLLDGALQARIREAKSKLMKDVSRRKVPITGVSEFPLLDAVGAPIGDPGSVTPKDGIDPAGLNAFIPDSADISGPDAMADPLLPMRFADPFETLRDRAEAHFEKTGQRPAIFLATLGPLAEHTARADFAQNLFAAGGVEAKAAPVPPETVSELAAAYAASGCQIAVLCGSDPRYTEEADTAAKALKEAGAQTLWLAGKHEGEGIDRHIFMGCDVVHELTLALTETGVN
ncbi:MAG: methylmalonyl-CoA mutase family protein [Pseudomonadota bacterium]